VHYGLVPDKTCRRHFTNKTTEPFYLKIISASKGQIKEQTIPLEFLEKNFSTSSMIITCSRLKVKL
jgi:hypothetical protein